MDDDAPRTLKTVETSLEVIRALKSLNGAGVTELADHLDMTPGTVYTHLATLRQNRYVRKDDDTYRLGLQFLTVGEFVRNHHPLYDAGRRETNRLAEETGETAHLMAEEFGLGIYLHRAKEHNEIVENFYASKTERPDYLHHSSTGKAVLAHMPRSRVEEIIDRYGLPALTDHTVTDPGTLFDQLETIRDRGYALNDEEELRGARAVGAPIFDRGEDVIGAISVSGPTGRIGDERFHDRLPDRVREAANVIGVNLEVEDYSPSLE